MLLEAIVVCGIIAGMAGSFYFFRFDRWSIEDCEGEIVADFAVQESLDRLSIFNERPKNKVFYSGSKAFHVSEKVEITDGVTNRLATVKVSWMSMNGKKDLSITRRKRWQAE